MSSFPCRLPLVILTCSASLLGCGNDTPAAPATGQLVVTTATVGVDPDPDGYTLELDGTSQGIGASATIQSGDIAEGSHTVGLTGVAANCTLAEPTRTAVVRPGEATQVDFAIACVARPDAGPPGPFPPGPPASRGRIVFENTPENDPGSIDKSIDIIDADGRNERVLRVGSVHAPAVSADGTHLAFDEFRDNADHLMVRSLGSSQDVEIPVPYFYGETAWSHDGTRLALVAATGRAEEIWTVNGDGTDLRQLTTMGGTNSAPTWSPDGRQLAFTHEDSLSSLDVLYVVQADGSDPHLILQMPSEIWSPAWSPDGTLIAFDSWADSEGESEIFVVEPRLGATPRRITFRPGLEHYAAWSPDGTSIAFASDMGSATFQIFTIPAEGGSATQVTRLPTGGRGGAVFPSWIP